MSSNPKVIVSFSGGKDSTAMLLRMIELGEHIDEVIWCDTYKEFPAMYRHVEKVRAIVDAAGIKFTVLKGEKSFDYYMFDHKPKRRKAAFAGKAGYSWPSAKIRWCTRVLKLSVIDRYLKKQNESNQIVQCIGIAADEGYRLERKANQSKNHRHPLVEWGWTEKDCIEYCRTRGFDWEGLYDKFKRVSCWCCPLKGFDEYRTLHDFYPDLWQELKEMDRRTYGTFLKNYSVSDLEIRFALEKDFLAQGKSIRSREFFNALKERLGKATEEGQP